ncbi:hypothetical protein GCM10009133_36680 [Cocleimonas flava]
MASQIIIRLKPHPKGPAKAVVSLCSAELVVSTKRNGKFAKVRHRFRKESLTYNDRQTTEPIKSQIV